MNSAFLPPVGLSQTTTSSSFATRPRTGARRATPSAVATPARKSKPATPATLSRLSPSSTTEGMMAKARTATEAARTKGSKDYSSRKPRTSTAAPEAGVSSRTSRKSSSTSSGVPVLTASELKRHLAERQGTTSVTVVKVFASYCASCRGAAGPFRKVVAAYAGEGVSFAKLDFAASEQFARNALGVDNLPYFAVFRGSRQVDGSAMGWRGLGSRLVERIEAVRDAALTE